jgi:hypothetical protein
MMEKEKIISKKYIIYGIFGLVIVLNIFCFPDLLNHQDIKLNDMSYMVMSNGIETPAVSAPVVKETLPPVVETPVTTDQVKVIQPKSTGYLVILLMLLAACLGSFAYYSYKFRDQISLLRIPKRDNRKEKIDIAVQDDDYYLLDD